MKFFLRFILLLIGTAFCSDYVFSQSNKIIISTLESNYTHGKQSKQNPFIIIGNFTKLGNEWIESSLDTNCLKKVKFNIFIKGKIIKTIETDFDTIMYERNGFSHSSYRLLNAKNFHFGKKTKTFTESFNTKKYRPLVASSSNYCRQIQKLRSRKSSYNDSLKVLTYLEENAKAENLGEIPKSEQNKNIIENISRVLYFNDSTFFIQASLNLNIYCYVDSVAFYDTENQSYHSDNYERESVSKTKFTEDAMFLVKGSKTIYIGKNMTLLDYGDYDNDGSDDVLFYYSHYYDGYYFVTNKLSTVLSSCFW